MIDAKIIVEVAIQNADKYNPCCSTLDREEACRASFKDGIEWYKEAIWHDKSEEPTQEGLIIVQGVLNGENLAIATNWKEVLREAIETGKKQGIRKRKLMNVYVLLGRSSETSTSGATSPTCYRKEVTNDGQSTDKSR